MISENSLVVIENGNPNGIPVVLIHGGAGGVWTWSETVKYLSEYRCVMPELPEHGSSHSRGPFSISGTAGRVIHYLNEQVPGGRAHLVGLSVGGQVVIEILSRAPHLALSAVISGALAIPAPGYHLGLYSETAMAFLYYIGVKPWKRNDAFIRMSMKLSSGMPPSVFEQYRQNFQSLTLSGWKRAMSAYYRYRLPAGLENVDTPVLLVAGRHEKADVQPTNKALHRLLPNSRSVILGDGLKTSAAQEHNWCVVWPQLFAETVKSWITDVPLPAEIEEILKTNG